jgi:hypothetical protein
MRITRAPLAIGVLVLGLGACKDGGGPNTPDDVIRLSVGETRTLTASEAASIEVGGGGGEFVLIPFSGSLTASSNVALEFTGTQISGVTGPPTPQIGPSSAPLLSRAASTEALGAAARFHGEMRRMERQVLGPKLAALRAARAGRLSPLDAVTGSAPVPNVNDQLSLNTARTPACGPSADIREGRVVAVTERAIIVADNNNPPGFTDAEYVQIAQEFDAIVYPTVTANFGVPQDLDQNGGRAVIFYTRAVNELTPANSDAVVGGFFHPRDLFPKTSTDPEFACASSNEAEMFYMLVPDDAGVVNGNVRTKASVRRGTVGVLAHEFQHLINASRRIYVNDATAFEEVWLNEGLSHIAEELVFYRASGLVPKQNITLATLRSSQTILDAVNAYQVSNLGRLIEYLEDPEQRTPFANDDELATRGATWSLLRYAADRSTTSQQQIWTNLANSRNAGVTNFNAVFGGAFLDMVRDWTVANYTDDAVLTTEAFRHPSWNFRDILPALLNPQVFPLKTRTLAAGTQLAITLKGGSAAYLRFGVPANGTATITATSSGATLPTTVSMTVVRTK